MGEKTDMNPYTLSNQQLEILDFFQNERSIACIYSSSDLAKHKLLISFIKITLLKGETILVRTGNSNSKNQILAAIAKENLSSLCLEIENESTIPGDDLNLDFVNDLEYHLESIKSGILYKKQFARLQEIREEYLKPIFGEYSQQKVAELLYLAQKRNLDQNLDIVLKVKNYIFNKKEFWYLRSKIEKAAKNYRKEYRYTKINDGFKSDVYKDFHLQQNQDIVFRYLQKFIKDSNSIIKNYESLFLQIRRDLVSNYQIKIRDLKKHISDFLLQLDYLEIDFEYASPKKVFSRQKDPLEKQKQEVRARYNLVLETLTELPFIKIKAPVNSWNPEVSTLKLYIQDLSLFLRNTNILIYNIVDEQIEVINQNNYHSPALSGIANQQSKLINAINETNLFKENFQNLSISSWQNFLFLKELNSQIKSNNQFLKEQISYGIWRSFENSLIPKALDLIFSLQETTPSIWVETYELWYFNALFSKSNYSSIVETKNTFRNLEEAKFLNNNFDSERIIQVFENKSYNLEKGEKAKWNQFIKTAQREDDNIDWNILQTASPNVFQTKFPLVIYSEQTLADDKVRALSYDYLICINHNEISLELIANSHYKGIGFFYSSFLTSEDFARISRAKNYLKKKKFDLKARSFSSQLKLDTVQKNRLSIAKILTTVLDESKIDTVFYSAKNFSIISCLSPFCGQLLAMELADQHTKELKYTHITSGIVEDVILKEDIFKIILVQDGFFDTNFDLEWQIMFMRNLEQIGLKLIHVSTFELAEGYKKNILDFVDMPEIRSHFTSAISH